MKISKIIKFY